MVKQREFGMSKLTVLHVTKSLKRGPGSFILDIHNGLKKAGVSSRVLVKHENCGYDFDSLLPKRNLKDKIRDNLWFYLEKYVLRYDRDYDPFSFRKNVNLRDTFMAKLNSMPAIDIIVFYAIENFLTFEDIRNASLLGKSKVFLYPVDAAFFTGGCHYPWSCNGYARTCGSCPVLRFPHSSDKSHKNLVKKKQFLGDVPISFIISTSWAKEKITNSSLFRDSRQRDIYAPVNEELFVKKDKNYARQKLGYKKSKRIGLIGAQNFANKRKGAKLLIDALEGLDTCDVQLIVIGKVNKELFHRVQIDVDFLGYVDFKETLPLLLNCVDFFICPSIEDGGPLMVNQSVMSGTPVISFDKGVAHDIITHGVTGWLCEKEDSESLQNGIRAMSEMSIDKLKTMSLKCREFGEKYLAIGPVVKQLIEYFEE